MTNEEELKRLLEERGKLKAEMRTIKAFLRAQRFTEQILGEWRKGHELMECSECGGLRGTKTWDKIR